MATVAMTMMMMTTTTGTSTATNVAAINNTETDQNPSNPSVFHDFLSAKAAAFHGPEPSASASASAGSRGARGPFSSNSDLGSERQMVTQVERISCYGPRNDHSVAEITNRFTGNKRSHSESAFIGSSREGFPQMNPESSHVMKMHRSASGGEILRASNYDVPLHGALQMRPVSASFMLQPTPGTNPSLTKPERLYNTCVGQSSVSYQIPLSRFRDGSSGPSVLSQLAADEGSRTGNKGSGILNSINASNMVSERNTSMLLPSRGNPASHNAEPESFNPLSRCGLASIGRQMTIIYAGHVHVFDDVHPNKADVIMALAGSNGGSWSTNLPKSLTTTASNDNYFPGGANETSTAGGSPLTRKYHNILSSMGNTVYGSGSGNQSAIVKDAGTRGREAASSLEPKHEV